MTYFFIALLFAFAILGATTAASRIYYFFTKNKRHREYFFQIQSQYDHRGVYYLKFFLGELYTLVTIREMPFGKKAVTMAQINAIEAAVKMGCNDLRKKLEAHEIVKRCYHCGENND